ncbi:MAG: CpaF family protein [Myxococcota bacterium]|nr:CpaF family protein [Myxococcota bacterium]
MRDRRDDPGALRRRLAGSRSAELRAWERRRTPVETGRERAEPTRPARPARSEDTGTLGLKAGLQQRVLDELGRRNLLDADEATLGGVVDELVASALANDELALNEGERRVLVDELRQEMLGLGPLAPLMSDPAVTDVLVVGADRVYVERFGKLELTGVRFRNDEHVMRVIERIATGVGRRIDASSPMADLRLRDGSRVNATIPPVSPRGPTLSIRRFGRRRLSARELVDFGSISPTMVDFLATSVRARKNILVSGGTGSGKSTLLGAMAEWIPAEERIVTIEDTLELMLDQEHVVSLETRPPNVEGSGRITARDLVVNSLRMRPDRVIVGEVRGGEALDMLQAMNTGHDGSLGTIHANSPRDALARLETMVLMAGVELPSRAIREQIAAAIHLLVQVRRYEDGVRRIEGIAEIVGLEGTTPLLQDLFRFEHRGVRQGRVQGEFAATGIMPHFAEELRSQGREMPLEWFQRAEPAR